MSYQQPIHNGQNIPLNLKEELFQRSQESHEKGQVEAFSKFISPANFVKTAEKVEFYL